MVGIQLDSRIWEGIKSDASKVVDRTSNILKNAHDDVKKRLPFSELSTIKTAISMEEIPFDIKSDGKSTRDADTNKANAALDWIAKMIQKLKIGMEANRLALTDIFGLFKEITDHIIRLDSDVERLKTMDAHVLDLRKYMDEKTKELDRKTETALEAAEEARQRGLKGNIIVSSPFIPAKPGKEAKSAILKRIGQQEPSARESDIDFSIRLIKERTGVLADKAEIMACHRLPAKQQGGTESYVVCFGNRKEGSSWDAISTAMMTGRSNRGGSVDYSKNIFLNFQLSKERAKLAKAVRDARRKGGLDRDSINPNGEIKVKVKGSAIWVKVTSLDHLQFLLPTPARVSR